MADNGGKGITVKIQADTAPLDVLKDKMQQCKGRAGMKTAFIIIAVVVGLALVFVFYCCCVVSGRCSRAEERAAILYRSPSEPPRAAERGMDNEIHG